MVLIEEKDVMFWWERAKAPWFGTLFDQMILKPGDPAMLRIARLREECLQRYKGTRRYKLSMNIAKIITDSYRETEGGHPAIRRALAMRDILRKVPITLSRYQLLAGTFSSGIGILEFYPSWSLGAMPSDTEKDMKDILEVVQGDERLIIFEEAERKIFKDEIFPYWHDKSYGAKEIESNYPETWAYYQNAEVLGGNPPLVGGWGLWHTVPDFNSFLLKGLDGVKAEIEQRIAELDPSHPTGIEDFDRRNMYQAMIIVADGLIEYANRYADLIEELSKKEEDPDRRKELSEMARICRKVPAKPADTWWEALQSLYFLYTGINLTQGDDSNSFGNFDQYMYPFLKKDLDKGTITLKEAQELLECFFCKCNETRGTGFNEFSAGGGHRDRINIGGQDADGTDRTNLLSKMCLEAHAHVHMNDPPLSARVHHRTSDEFLKMALETVRLGTGNPYIVSDEALVPGFLAMGVPLHVARNYADLGCQECVTDPNVCPGADTNGRTNTGFTNMVKPIELAIWDGFNPVTGKQAGPKTGDPRTFRNFNEFMEAVKKQVEVSVYHNVVGENVREYVQQKFFPHIFHNLMHPGPRETGIDMDAGGCRYNWAGTLAVGTANVGDILAAVKYLVYDRKETTWDELLAALKSDWVGYEDLRQKCIRAPKYGAANEYADDLTREYLEAFFKAWESFNTPRRRPGRFTCGLVSMGSHMTLGRKTGATPDGRRAGEHLADACSPSVYAPALGPAATHLSAARAIDTTHTVNGIIFNQKFSLSSLLSDREVSKWMDLVKTYVDMGGQQVTYSIVDRETLLDAQKHPEQYGDLWVRVGGFSALFIDLPKELQDQIIARAEFSL